MPCATMITRKDAIQFGRERTHAKCAWGERHLSRESRLKLISEIEEARGSRLLVAVWGDRQNLSTIIAPDAHDVFFQHLEKIGKVNKLDVLLYTTGGHTLAAWGLANLVREYCDQLGVLIPHRALSSGT